MNVSDTARTPAPLDAERLRASGPRERLAALGSAALTDEELVALVLRTGHPNRDAHALAQSLVGRGDGLARLVDAELSELCTVPGVGVAKAASVIAAIELGRRLSVTPLARGDRIGGPHDVSRHFFQRFRGEHREHFVVLLLDGRHRLICEYQVSQGTLTASLVHPREVFRPAVRAAAAAIVLVHNHPSGDPTPSAEDLEVTDRLASAGALLGIRVVDHVVVAAEGFHSLRDHGQLE